MVDWRAAHPPIFSDLMMNSLSYIRQLLYTLKQRYGAVATIDRILKSDINIETGVKADTLQTFTIRRAIILPFAFARQILIEAGVVNHKTFYDSRERKIIIDKKDLKELKQDDKIKFQNKNYEIVNIDQIFEEYSYLATIKEVNNE